MDIAGTRALITGATGGLGQAISRALAREGASVILTGRRTQVLEPLATELAATSIACDLSDPDDVDRLVTSSGDVDILVLNAGLPGAGKVSDLSLADIDRTISVNLRSPIVTSMAFGKAMVQRGRGHIVMISSLSGLTASPRSSLYNATKFGLRGFGLAIRQEFGEFGVGVSVILPGFIREAGMFADAGVTLPAGTRTKSPEDVAKAVVQSIRNNRAEILVAPLELRIGAKLGSIAPSISAAAQRTAVARRTGEAMESAQRKVK